MSHPTSSKVSKSVRNGPKRGEPPHICDFFFFKVPPGENAVDTWGAPLPRIWNISGSARTPPGIYETLWKITLPSSQKGIHGATHCRACCCFSCMPSFPLECYENYEKLHLDRSSRAAVPLNSDVSFGDPICHSDVQSVSRASNKTG